MAKTGMSIKGMDSLKRKLAKLPEEGRSQARVVIRTSAVNIQNKAKIRSPRDPQRPPKDLSAKVSGLLRNSITHQIINAGLGAVIGTNRFYAPFQEFGTAFIPARPFLLPAFEEEYPNFMAAMRRITFAGLARDAQGRFVARDS